MTRSQAREHAFCILYSEEFRKDASAETLISTYLSDFPQEKVREADRAFIEKEVKGTLEHLPEIDQKISAHLKGWSLERLARVDLAILRLAVYEMEYAPDIPDSVSINEAVELAKHYSQEQSKAFVNGVLSNFAPGRNQSAQGKV